MMHRQLPDRPVQRRPLNGTIDAERRAERRRSEVRHGHVYTDSPDPTVRAVTPDSAGSQFDITALPSPSAFPHSNSSRFQAREQSASVSNTDEEGTIDGRRRKVKKKRHQDKSQPDTSPNSFFDKTRKRLNSITTSSSHTPRQDDSSLSIGFPSVVQASVFPDFQDIRQQLPRTPRRTISEDAGLVTSGASLNTPVVIESDAEKILKLMKTTTGRMHGILFYRPIGTSAWHSSYCAINVAPGSLVCQTKGDPRQAEVLIPDLRGCTVRTHYDAGDQSAYLSVVLPVSGLGYQLRPPVPETFDSWLAALLCWQPLKPKGVHDKLAKPQSISMTDRSSMTNRRMSDVSSPKSTAVVKSSQMLLWDGVLPSSSYQRHQEHPKPGQPNQSPWRRVNCNLHENGTFRLLDEDTASPLRTLKLNTLGRCAIQRLDPSVLGAPYCIAIHPQYTSGNVRPATANPLVLSLSSRVAFEAWVVLLQAMTVPDLYGPETVEMSTSQVGNRSSSKSMFRIERLLHVRIIEARFPEYAKREPQDPAQHARLVQKHWDRRDAKIYADIMLGRDLRARTVQKPFSNSIFWADEFSLPDIPSILSRVSVVLKVGNPDEKEWTMTTNGDHEAQDLGEAPNFEAIEIISHDPLLGKVDVPLHDLEQDKFVEQWWPLYDANGSDVGQALIKLSLEESTVLMDAEYSELAALLHNFDNSLTPQLGQSLGTELKALSDVLLDIYQVSGKVEDWINNLVEEEIDGIYREQPPIRMRFSGRIHSNDSYETAEQREMLVRDLSRSATMEANLLFRGNSLVTKALDAHMRRLGKDYLERTLGEKLRSIVANDPNCEVDPIKVKSTEQLDRNWSNLIGLTTSIWHAIAISASQCPSGMRNVLKHIRSCAEDRYGSFIRTVKYTSVSGFLFLRFFCPAILNPQLFGILANHPPERPRRTLTLIAKSLIALANMAKVGQKEAWMEPMNRFITAATPEFKTFIEQICSWTASQETLHEPQYQAALQVKSRLPPLTREGLLSLPFLLDSAKSYAVLVDIWVDAPKQNVNPHADGAFQAFDNLCHAIHRRTRDCLAAAEVAREPDFDLDKQKWQKMLHQQPNANYEHNLCEDINVETDITALPQPRNTSYSSRRIYSSGADNVIIPIEEHYENESPRDEYHRTMTSSTNSSSASFDPPMDYGNRQGIRSRDGSSRQRHLEISNHRRGRINDMSTMNDNLI